MSWMYAYSHLYGISDFEANLLSASSYAMKDKGKYLIRVCIW